MLLTADDLSFSADGGFRVSFLRDISEGAWEISWLSSSWDSRAQIAEAGNIDSVLNTTGFVTADAPDGHL